MLARLLIPCITAAFLVACGDDDDDPSVPPADPPTAPPQNPPVDPPVDQPPAETRAGYIDRLEIRNRTDAFEGRSFGSVGPYEYIAAVAHGKLDPMHPANAGIVDLDKAPRGEDGYVAYQSDVVILRPKNPDTARRVLFYDVVNRGNKNSLRFNNGSGDLNSAEGAGDGLLMREGYTLVWSGWQGDIPLSGDGGRVGTQFPVATNPDGSPITGTNRDEFVFDNSTSPIDARLNYPAADLASSSATLRVKNRQEDPWTNVSTWSYVDEQTLRIERPADMDAGAIYEFIYPAKDPKVMGIGFLALRDIVSFLRNEEADAHGAPNPLLDLRQARCEIVDSSGACPENPETTVDVAILEGISQSGRMVRDFIWQGYNTDIEGRKVFDGAMPLIAGSRKTWTNYRFAQPGRWSKQHEEHFQAGDQFPFTYATTTDPISGATDGIFAKCSTNDTCPKLMHIDGGGEFWQARASLLVTDGAGNEVPVPDSVRLYYMTGTPHGYTGAGYAGVVPPTPTACKYPTNIVNANFVPRAMTLALVDWIARGVEPPASQWPTLSSGTLADPSVQSQVGFPDLSPVGVNYTGVHNFLQLTDYSVVPPVVDASRPYRVLVPTTDADGNDLAGIRPPDVSVPLGTSLSWNPRKAGFGENDACGGTGSFIPFAYDAGDRGSDPRPAVTERYASEADYIGKVAAAANALHGQGLMLAEDVSWWLDRAQNAIAASR
jgi:hypothetical protein